MARVPLLNGDDEGIPPGAREALAAATGSRGRLINLYRALANRPEALRGFIGLGSTVYGRGSTLTRSQAELAYTTATVVNHCYY